VLFEAAKSSARRTAPDHAYYAQVKDRLSANRATLSTARKLARHARHVLVELGEQALASAFHEGVVAVVWAAVGWCERRSGRSRVAGGAAVRAEGHLGRLAVSVA
jgi:hypothetical protein